MSGFGAVFGGLFSKKQDEIKEPKTIEQVKYKPDALSALVKEALKYKNIHEKGGNNKGPEVEMFQKAVDGKASGEAWCMAFVQYCIKKVQTELNIKSNIYKAEHCMTVWNKSPESMRVAKPAPGCVVIWRHGNTTNGHTGIITEIVDNDYFMSIEGNTGPSDDVVVREGDGVYRKRRAMKGNGDMKVVGFLNPWA